MKNHPAYLIANFTVTDSEKFLEYRDLFRETIKPLMQREEARMIIFTTKETLGVKEETPAEKIVIIKFKNREIADTWYHSDEYQATIQTRLESTRDSWLTITDQFIPPTAT
jgi:uncharacterized protein (DUF1330 family)